MKVKIDLSKFKLKHKDDKVATLVHGTDGHEVKLVIKALHPMNRANLDKLELHKSVEKQDHKLQPPEVQPQKMAQGGVAGDWHSQSPCLNPNCKSVGRPHPNCRCYGGGYAEGGEVQSCCAMKVPHDKTCQYFADGGDVNASPLDIEALDNKLQATPINNNSLDIEALDNSGTPPSPASPQPGLPSSSEPPLPADSSGQGGINESPELSAIPDQPKAASMGAPPQTPPEMVQPGVAGMMQAGAEGLKGSALEAQGMEAISNEKAKNYATTISALAKNQQHYQESVNDVNNEIKQTVQELRDYKIDPNHYMGSLSTMGKISTGLGLFLGGIGSGMTGMPSQAMEFVNKQIDRDIESQKMQLNKKDTLLSANYKRLGNLKDAADFTRVQMLAIAQMQGDQALAKQGGTLAQAHRNMFNSTLEQEIATKSQPLIMKQFAFNAMGKISSGQQLTPSDMTNLAIADPALHKTATDATYPGIGTSQGLQPITQESRTALEAQQQMMTVMQRIRDLASRSTWDKLHPSERASAATAMGELQQLYTKAFGTSIAGPAQKELKEITGSSPATIFDQLSPNKAKYDTLMSTLVDRHNITRAASGLPKYDANGQKMKTLSPQHQAIADWALKQPAGSNPKADMALKQLGLSR
jgi:hypothetical protein